MLGALVYCTFFSTVTVTLLFIGVFLLFVPRCQPAPFIVVTAIFAKRHFKVSMNVVRSIQSPWFPPAVLQMERAKGAIG